MYLDKNCPHFCYQTENPHEPEDTEPVIWCCTLMTGDQDHEGNCGQYPCPLGKPLPPKKVDPCDTGKCPIGIGNKDECFGMCHMFE
jgi:hypothetical protein